MCYKIETLASMVVRIQISHRKENSQFLVIKLNWFKNFAIVLRKLSSMIDTIPVKSGIRDTNLSDLPVFCNYIKSNAYITLKRCNIPLNKVLLQPK